LANFPRKTRAKYLDPAPKMELRIWLLLLCSLFFLMEGHSEIEKKKKRGSKKNQTSVIRLKKQEKLVL